MYLKYSGMALLVAGIMVLAGCQKMEEGRPVARGKYTLTLEATKGAEGTKALALDGKTLSAGWANGETVAPYQESVWVGDLSVAVNKGSKATLSGDFDPAVSLSQGNSLTLLFPRASWDYTGQKGQLLKEDYSIEKKYDFALASVTVNSIEGTNATASDAVFQTQQSIYRLGFAEDKTLEVAGFQIAAESDELVQRISFESGVTVCGPLNVTPEKATDELLYVALRNKNQTADETYHFNVTGSDEAVYVGSKTVAQKHLEEYGKFLSAKDIPVVKAQVGKSGESTGSKANIW